MSARFFLGAGLLFLVLAVILGAFGAHALKATLTSQQMQTWQTASFYHFVHALGLVLLGLRHNQKPPARLTQTAGIMLGLGILLFSGSLYLLVITSTPSLGMITPVGGLLFILGWSSWFLSVLKNG